MNKFIFLLILFFFSGCGKPLVPYNFKDAVLVKKYVMHYELGEISKNTSDAISTLRLQLQNGSITSEKFRDEEKSIRDNQQNKIKKIQNNFNQYINANQTKP